MYDNQITSSCHINFSNKQCNVVQTEPDDGKGLRVFIDCYKKKYMMMGVFYEVNCLYSPRMVGKRFNYKLYTTCCVDITISNSHLLVFHTC